MGTDREFGISTARDFSRPVVDVSFSQGRTAVVASQSPGHSDLFWRHGVDGGIPQSGH